MTEDAARGQHRKPDEMLWLKRSAARHLPRRNRYAGTVEWDVLDYTIFEDEHGREWVLVDATLFESEMVPHIERGRMADDLPG